MSSQPQLHAYIKDKIKNTQFFKTNINEFVVVACFGTETYGELTKYSIKHFNADVAILVDLQTKTINVTKKEDSSFKLNEFVQIFCEGKVNLNKAHGTFNEKFIQFTKKFKPC